MGATQSKSSGPDLAGGISVDDISDGSMLAGHVGEEPILLARQGNKPWYWAQASSVSRLRHRCVPARSSPCGGAGKARMQRILGPQMGDFVRSLYEENGVVFHLEEQVIAIHSKRVRLKSGGELEADLVVAGTAVRPRTELADKAGLKLDRGVIVDEYLETTAPGIFAAGDIARWPDPHSGERIRVEHWVVAQCQGHTAVPFFWSQHYDVPINYVGHAESWDELKIDGDIGARDCLLHYRRNGRVLAVASIYRDIESLAAEKEMEQDATG